MDQDDKIIVPLSYLEREINEYLFILQNISMKNDKHSKVASLNLIH